MKHLGKMLWAFTILLFAAAPAMASYKISGRVVNEKEKPLKGVSVSLENTIDGGTTDSLGNFSFTTDEKGNQTIVATDISHDNAGQPLDINRDISGIIIRMHSKAAHELDMVVITAGSFDASNDKSKTVLKPLDIVTTAGANADVVKAIETLPGTQQTGTENGLFVRGGDASEAAILVDEMVVQNAFFSGAPGVATRSRFGAFQYQGVSFSSGGYSAKYGQALSGVLELTTTDMPDKSTVNLGLNMAGIYASGTKKWKTAALDFGGSYNNLTPFYGLAATNFNYYKVPVGGGGNMRFVWQPNKTGILKVSANYTLFESAITIPNPYATDSANSGNPFVQQGPNINFVTKDLNYYGNASYKQMFKDKYSLYTAASYSYDQTNNQFGTVPITEKDQRTQLRIEGKDYFTNRLNLLLGAEVQNFGIDKSINASMYNFDRNFTETHIAGYTELEWTPINRIAFRPGIRYEHSQLLASSDVAPRFSMAIKTSTNSQVSLAGGLFYQDPDNQYLLLGKRPNLQQATHYIANWQYSKTDRTLRLEAYYKNYQDLVLEQYNHVFFDPNTYRNLSDTITLNNNGHGYAQGFELFYRDKKSLKNLDYWVSYSYIDTRRLYQNYPYMATPTFIANHNLNLVAKYFVNKLNTNFSATYTYASGYPYYNPDKPLNSNTFLSDQTPSFNNLAITVSYLHTFGKWFTVFYLSVDNIANFHNVFGYRYSYDNAGNVTGSTPVVPALYRSVFFGVNMSLTQFKKDEL